MIVLEFAVAIVAGIFAGLTGGGGGIIYVPLLIAMGESPISAVAASNLAIVITTVAATMHNARAGLVPWRRVGMIAIGAVVMGPIGSYLGLRLSSLALLIGLIVLNLVNLVVIELRSRKVAPSSDIRDGEDHGSTNPVKIASTGAAGGLLAGLFGIGGGIVMVPLQVGWLHTPIRVAARISLAVIIVTSGSAFIGYLIQGGFVDWSRAIMLGIGGVIGAPIGSHFLRRISAHTATRILQVVLVFVTLSLVWRAFT